MFAFVIHDKGDAKSPPVPFFVRDRFGEKPLYYQHTPDLLEIASELQALCGSPSYSLQALNAYLALGYVPSPLGFWKALDEVFPTTQRQRSWLHKTANVLNKAALSVQANMKKDPPEVYLAPNRALAEMAIDLFVEKYRAKYDKAVECLTKDRQALLALYDFPAEHWDHLRTTNPIESVFATVRHRTVRTKGSLLPTTAKLMVFKLLCAASKRGRTRSGIPKT